MIERIESSLKWAKLEVSKLNQDVADIRGLTSMKVRCFLNNICSEENAVYLEIGSYKGATFFSALYGNDINAIAIDNWRVEKIMPAITPLWASLGESVVKTKPKDVFLQNLKKFKGTNNVQILDENYLNFNKKSLLYKPNIVFYDGEHTFKDQYQVLTDFKDYLADEFVLIVDDWNWEKRGVLKGIKDLNLNVKYKKEIFTKGEDPSDFWNGLGIFILEK